MDRRRRTALILAGGLCLAAAAPLSPPLRELRWLAEGADRGRALTTKAPGCLDPRLAASPDVQIGAAAFGDPLLLGGQAARAGLSCDSCHRNGRSNAEFIFPGISGRPGTADVTSSLFSRKRGDGAFNPKTIPDLGAAKPELKIDQSGPALDRFIHGLVVEEFDGAEPPAAVLAGLAAYVRAQTPAACAIGRTPITVNDIAKEATAAVSLSLRGLDQDDAGLALAMLRAGRARLGRIAERYPAREFAQAHARLVAADLDLAAAMDAVRRGDGKASQMIEAWLARVADWRAPLVQAEPRSLFAPKPLAQALGERVENRPLQKEGAAN